MKTFKWNTKSTDIAIWDPVGGDEHIVQRTDKEFINNPFQAQYEDVLRALCRVASELIALEEQRENGENK